jgi:histone-lysine N-methyltransferase SETMAR
MTGSMLQTLESHGASSFHFLWTGDKSWMFYEYIRAIMRAVSWDEVDELERPMHYHRKTMITALFNGTGECLLNILPRSGSMHTSYFAGDTTGGLEDVCYPEGRNPHERKRTLHFDSAPMHNTRAVRGQLEQPGFKRMEHPPYSPDLAPCDFFLLGHMKEQLKGRSFAEEEELSLVLSQCMSEIPPDMILRVFADWDRRLRRCLLMEGEYVEYRFNLNWFLTDLNKRARRVRVLNARYVVLHNVLSFLVSLQTCSLMYTFIHLNCFIHASRTVIIVSFFLVRFRCKYA